MLCASNAKDKQRWLGCIQMAASRGNSSDSIYPMSFGNVGNQRTVEQTVESQKDWKRVGSQKPWKPVLRLRALVSQKKLRFQDKGMRWLGLVPVDLPPSNFAFAKRHHKHTACCAS